MRGEMSHQEPLLRVEHLCQYFNTGDTVTKAVDDVSFDIRQGEVFGLVGESGCGKTTLGRSIVRLCPITSGNVYLKGVRIAAGVQSYRDAIARAKSEYAIQSGRPGADRAALRSRLDAFVREQERQIRLARQDQKPCGGKLAAQIQMIFQDPVDSLEPKMTVGEILSEGLFLQGERDKKAVHRKVCGMLELVGLEREHIARYPHELSGGQRQRVGVARSLILEPELLIADEPVSALDVSVQAQVIQLLQEMREKSGLTILFIAHDLSVVKYFCDRIGVMYGGRLVELAEAGELFARPLHPYTRSLLSAVPLPDPVYEKSRRQIPYRPPAKQGAAADAQAWREARPGHFVRCSGAE